jgi:hypothetical protein
MRGAARWGFTLLQLLVVAALLFFGALLWAEGRDPFQRVWFAVKAPGQGKVKCMAVVPKGSLKSKVQSLKSEGQPAFVGLPPPSDYGETSRRGKSPESGGGRWPVVVYLHGSGGSLLGDGNELRQRAPGISLKMPGLQAGRAM